MESCTASVKDNALAIRPGDARPGPLRNARPCRRSTDYTRRTGVSVVKIGLCGHGYWGQNLLRTFASDPRFEVVAVSDIRESARERVRRTSTAIRLYEDGTEVIDDPEVEAVAIATPAATHFSLARRALARDQHRKTHVRQRGRGKRTGGARRPQRRYLDGRPYLSFPRRGREAAPVASERLARRRFLL